jgi:hypothetical protein
MLAHQTLLAGITVIADLGLLACLTTGVVTRHEAGSRNILQSQEEQRRHATE